MDLENYHFFAPLQEALKQKKKDDLKNTTTGDTINKNAPFVPVTCIKEANAWNEGLKDAFDRFPALRQNFGFVGECHEHNAALRIAMKREFLKNFAAEYPNESRKQLRLWADEKVKKYMEKIGVKEEAYAQSFSFKPTTSLYHFRGVTINKDWGKDSAYFIEQLKKDVVDNFHPICCDTIRYVLDHEVGHQLDDMLNISGLENIQKLFNSMDNATLTHELSEYAWNNGNKKRYAEFIAEGWAEYCNNPNPRRVAREIGQTIEKRYAEWTGKNL